MNPKLLIVTPTLGESPFLDRTMETVRRQAPEALKVISCPARRIDALRERFPDCQFVADAGREGGIYGALNAALKCVQAREWDWFTYINDDDELGDGFAETAGRHWNRGRSEGVVYGDVRRIDERGCSLGFITVEHDPRYLPGVLHETISPINQQGMLFRRDVVEGLGGFDLGYKLCADLDFWVRAYAQGWGFRYYPLEAGRFRIRPGQLSGDVDLTRREFRDIVTRHLPQDRSSLRRKAARLRYRLFNLPRYLARLRKVGLRTSERTLAGT